MKKQKIGIDIRAIGKQRTGDEYYTLSLVREILKIDKYNHYFFLTNTQDVDEIEGKIFAGIDNENAKIISILPSFKPLWTFFCLPRMAKKLDLDILHVQYITPFWFLNKIKLVTTIADVSFNAHPDLVNRVDLFFLKTLIPLSLKKSNKIIAVSEFTKKEIIKYHKITPDKIVTIHNGESSDFFYKQIKDKKSIIKKLEIRKPYLFYIGTHQPRKDLPTLIKAFFDLKEKHSSEKEIQNLQLVIGGKIKAHNYDPRINEVLNNAKNNLTKRRLLEDIIFTGYLDDKELVTVYQEAKIFVYPSLYEGFGLPLIEAMVSKTPVVCSDIKCFREIAGNAARFYEPKNSNSLQKVLFEVIMKSSVRIDLIKKGLENAKRFSWKMAAKKTLKVFLGE